MAKDRLHQELDIILTSNSPKLKEAVVFIIHKSAQQIQKSPSKKRPAK